jgi:hypothetical protein
MSFMTGRQTSVPEILAVIFFDSRNFAVETSPACDVKFTPFAANIIFLVDFLPFDDNFLFIEIMTPNI